MTLDTSSARVRIYALGGFRLLVDGRELRLRTRKEAMVLLRLALADTSGVTRDDCLAMLWPESSEPRARHSLSEALRGIEQATGLVIRRTSERLRIDEGSVATDVAELEAAMRKGDVFECARLYVGGFLAGWYAPTAEASHWVDAQAAAVSRALEKTLRTQLGARRQATDSRGVTATVALLEKLGVATESDREAAAEAEQITGWESLRPGEAIQPRIPLDREGPFVGRTEEMKLLTAELERALAGEVRVVLVSGEAGIGKTRTCQRLARLAALRGFRLFMSTCYELEQSVAFGAIGEAFGGAVTPSDLAGLKPLWQGVLSEVIPILAPVVGGIPTSEAPDLHSRENWILEAIRALVESMGSVRPEFLLIDDVQWADSATCRLLHHMARRAEPLAGLLMVFAYRDLAPGSPGDVLVRELQATRVHLGPLNLKDARAQIAPFVGANNRGRLDRLARQSGGNPFFARELALADTLSGDTPPRSVQDVVLSRTKRLPFEPQRVLSLISVAGGRLHLDVLAAALEAEPIDLLEAISLLRDHGLVKEAGAVLCLDHEMIRSSIYASLGEPLRRSLHTRLATVRPDHMGNAARAHHYELGGHPHEASRAALAAANDDALRYATEEKLDLLETALRTADRTNRNEIAGAYAAACLEGGQYGRAVARLSGEADLPDDVRLKLDVAELKRASLRDFQSLEHAMAAANGVLKRAQGYPFEFIEAAREKLRYGHEAGDASIVIAAVDDLSRLAELHPDSPFAGRALCLAAYQRAFYAPGPEVECSLSDALRIGEDLGDSQLQVQARLGLGVWAVINGRTNECLRQGRIALDQARTSGFVVEELRSRVLLMCVDLDRMQFRRVIRHAAIVKGRANDVDHWNAAMLARLNSAAAWWELGEYLRVDEETRAALALESGHPDWLVRVNAHALAGRAALALGRIEDASIHREEVLLHCHNLEAWVDDPAQVLGFLTTFMTRERRIDQALDLAQRVADGCRGRNTSGYWVATVTHAQIAVRSRCPIDAQDIQAIRDQARENGNVLISQRAEEILTSSEIQGRS